MESQEIQLGIQGLDSYDDIPEKRWHDCIKINVDIYT